MDDSLDVEGDDGLAAEGGFEEGDVLGVVMEEVLADGCRQLLGSSGVIAIQSEVVLDQLFD